MNNRDRYEMKSVEIGSTYDKCRKRLKRIIKIQDLTLNMVATLAAIILTGMICMTNTAFAADTMIDSKPPAKTGLSTATFAFSSEDPAATFECKLDDDAQGYQPCSSPTTYNQLYGGTHSFKARSVDAGGNRDLTPATNEWTILNSMVGSVYAWGYNGQGGTLGIGTTDFDPHPLAQKIGAPIGFTQVAGGGLHSVALRNDGRVWAWGNGDAGQLGIGTQSRIAYPVQVSNITDVIKVSAGNRFSIALKSDGTVWQWGQIDTGTGSAGPLTPQQMPGVSEIIDISAGIHHVLALKADGTVWTWGIDQYGELGLGSSGFTQNTPVQVPGLSNIKSVATKYYHSLALDASANIWSWGWNQYYQLGDNTSTNRSSPVSFIKPALMPAITSISAGYGHSLAIDVNGNAWSWGYNWNGQAGIGSTSDTVSPTKITSINNIAKTAAGYLDSVFLTTFGTVWVAGSNMYGQIGRGLYDTLDHALPEKVAYLSGVDDIAMGGDHILSLSSTWITTDFGTAWTAYSSIAIDSNGAIHIAYPGGSGSTARLEYMTNASGAWVTTHIDQGTNISINNTSLVLDGNDIPHISYTYFDYNLPSNRWQILKYASKDITTGAWQVEVIENRWNAQAGGFAVSGGKVYISYYDQNAGCNTLRLARKDTVWETLAIDATCGVGYSSSMIIDPSGSAHISYLSSLNVKYSTGLVTAATPTFASTVVDSIASWSFQNTSISLDSSGNPSIGYVEQLGTGLYRLKYAYFNGSVWSKEIVDNSEASIGMYGCSHKVINNTPYIAYSDDTNRDLKIARRIGNQWKYSVVDMNGDVGERPSLTYDQSGSMYIVYRVSNDSVLRLARNFDDVGPTGTMTINAGAGYTNTRPVNLGMTCGDGLGLGCWQMKFSNDGESWTDWELYADNKTYTLPAFDGTRTVYVRFRDGVNNWSPVYSNSIVLDTTSPTGTIAINNNPNPDWTNNFLVSLTLSASDTNTVTDIQLSNDSGNWMTYPYATATAWSLSPLLGDKSLRRVYVKFKDIAGNWSSPVFDTIYLDNSAPVTHALPAGSSNLGQPVGVHLSCNDGSGCPSTYFTTTGADPTTNSALYTGGAITIQDNTTLKFFSVDSLGNTEAVKMETYNFTQVATKLSILLSTQTIVQTGGVDVSGSLSQYSTSSIDLNNLPITLIVTGPTGTLLINTLTDSSIGHYVVRNIGGFSQKGTYGIKASFAGTGLLQAVNSNTEALLVGNSAGYAVIVEGKVGNDEGLASHNKTANRVYQHLLDRGFAATNIFYYNYNSGQPGVSGTPSKAGIQNAIENLVRIKMNNVPAPLWVVMVDHGSPDKFYLGNEEISPADLNLWLSHLEYGPNLDATNGLSASALLEKRIIIIGSCYSGSFIPSLASAPSGTNAGRSIITSAAASEESYKGPQEPDGIRSGEFFLEEFFKELAKGSNLKESFIMATDHTKAFTSQGDGSANGTGYFGDTAVQHPLLDDDGIGIGSNSLSDGAGDGVASGDVYLGVGLTNSTANPADIKSVTPTLHLDQNTTSAVLWARPDVYSYSDTAWIEVKAPTTKLTSRGGTGQLELTIPRVFLDSYDVQQQWQYTYGADCGANECFSDPGKYEIYYFTRNMFTDEISSLKRSLVYKDKAGNNPPNAFSLLSPADTATVRTILPVSWEAKGDPDNNPLTYTVQISTSQTFTSVAYQKEEITDTIASIESDAGLVDGTTYYWRVLAIDAYGAATASQTWSFIASNTNGLGGMIKGYVTDSQTGAPIANATITTSSSGAVTTATNGAYVITVAAGSLTLQATAAGYQDSAINSITVSSGDVLARNVQMANSSPIQYALTVSNIGTGAGTITSNPSGINCGASCSKDYGQNTAVTLTAAAGTGSVFSGWTGDCSGSGICQVGMTNDRSVSAVFNIKTYSIVSDAANGTITCLPSIVNHGASSTCSITPDTGYSISDVLVDGSSVGAPALFTFSNVVAPHTIKAKLTPNTYTVTAQGDANGTVAPATQLVNHGNSSTIALTPKTGYHISAVNGCGGTLSGNAYTTGVVTSTCSIVVSFAVDLPNTYAVTPSAGTGGTISPNTAQTVAAGGTTSFAITPSAGYQIGTVNGCGGTLNGNIYMITGITADCTIAAGFTQLKTVPDGHLVGTEVTIADALRALHIAAGFNGQRPCAWRRRASCAGHSATRW